MNFKKLLTINIIILCICFISADSLLLPRRDPFSGQISEQDSGISISGEESLFIYNVIYRNPESLVQIIRALYPDIGITAETESKQIIIKSTESEFKDLLPHLKKLDAALDQILIEVKVVEVNENQLKRLGIVWDLQHDGIAISGKNKASDYIKKLELLIGKGQATLLANPKVTTLVGQEATIHIGDKIPYSVPVESATGKISWSINYIDAGVNLKILPQKAEKNFIALMLSPEVSSISQWKETPGGQFPIISTRQVNTSLRLKNGRSFVIGGLINEENRENILKVPVLGDIPLINVFFKHSSFEKIKSDVLFIVTAKKV
jgi:type II secretory pathway component GspD/PulD (secretin)